jgi:hypothetical protein
MIFSSMPPKFAVPFANAAGAAYIRQIPLPSQSGVTPGAASLTDGFPPETFTSISAGGTPPRGQDFNGLLNQITAWVRWLSAGGAVRYDATFAAAIGGYPNGAIVSSNSAIQKLWWNTTDNNITNPDAGGAGWVDLFSLLAPKLSPNFTGVPTGPTAALNTNNSQLATTAFVIGQASTDAPLMDGTAAVGGGARYARWDHVHPTDIHRAPQKLLAAYAGRNDFVVTANWGPVPPNVDRAWVRLWGGGGAGGTGGSWPGGGGGHGGYCEMLVANLVPGSYVPMTIGVGGGQNGIPGAGGNGGTTIFGSYCTATGGAGGAGNTNNPAGGAGGSGSGAPLIFGGAHGTDGIPVANKGGDGGGPCGGRGVTGSGGGQATNGIPGNGYGGGGGGSAPGGLGGSGSPGLIIVEY